MELKFIVDRNVGKMAKWLRMAGFDAILFASADDAAMIAAALAEERILVTRDRRIMKRRMIAQGRIRAILIESDRSREQARQLMAAPGLDRSRFRPFTVCLECNRPLEERDKEAVKERLPPHVYLTQDRFAECPGCGRLYWPGTHRQAMIREFDAIADGENRRAGGII